MAFLTGQRLTADLLNQNLQGTTTPITADSATYTTTEAVIATWSASLVNGQNYEVVADVSIRTSVAADVSLVRIREDNLTGNQLQGINVALPSASSGGNPAHLRGEYTATATGSKTFVLTGVRNGGTGNHNLKASSSSPALFRVQALVN